MKNSPPHRWHTVFSLNTSRKESLRISLMGATSISYPSTMNVLGFWPQLSVAEKRAISLPNIPQRQMSTNIPEPKAGQLLWLQPWFSTWDWVPVVTFLTLTLSNTRGWSPNLSLEERSLMGWQCRSSLWQASKAGTSPRRWLPVA